MQGRIVFATGNAGKMKEIRLIMEDLGCEVVSNDHGGHQNGGGIHERCGDYGRY